MQHAECWESASAPGEVAGVCQEPESLESVNEAPNMRRLFGPLGGAFRQDVLVTEDADGPLAGD